MFNAKSLTDDQIATIHSWVDDGAQLADIQKYMEEELGIRVTYMDTRFLVIDLGLEIKKEEEEAPEEPEENIQEVNAELTEDDIEVLPHDAGAAGGPVNVTVDEIARPGVMVSGKVTFPDGEGGMWYVDEMGRLGIDPDTPGYRPSESNLIAFQKRLQEVMERS